MMRTYIDYSLILIVLILMSTLSVVELYPDTLINIKRGDEWIKNNIILVGDSILNYDEHKWYKIIDVKPYDIFVIDDTHDFYLSINEIWVFSNYSDDKLIFNLPLNKRTFIN